MLPSATNFFVHSGRFHSKALYITSRQIQVAEQPLTYQHFVPQFLSRNFAHPYADPGTVTKKPRRKKHEKGRPFPGELVVNHVNLSVDPPQLVESLARRTLGPMDMYCDTDQASRKQQHVEETLSKIESRASTIFRRITEESPSRFLVSAKVPRLDLPSKVLPCGCEDYSGEDSPLLRDHMGERGFKRPVDVWLSNLRAIVELKMDPGANWEELILKRIYPADAVWFIGHVQFMYMAVCTLSSNCSQEVVLTDNCYNVFEGPMALARDRNSGQLRETLYANLHEFSPISPKLILVLRSHRFPSLEGDADPTI